MVLECTGADLRPTDRAVNEGHAWAVPIGSGSNATFPHGEWRLLSWGYSVRLDQVRCAGGVDVDHLSGLDNHLLGLHIHAGIPARDDQLNFLGRRRIEEVAGVDQLDQATPPGCPRQPGREPLSASSKLRCLRPVARPGDDDRDGERVAVVGVIRYQVPFSVYLLSFRRRFRLQACGRKKTELKTIRP